MMTERSSETCPRCGRTASGHLTEDGVWRDCVPMTALETSLRGRHGTDRDGELVVCPHCRKALVIDHEHGLYSDPAAQHVVIKYSESTSVTVRPGSELECPYCGRFISFDSVRVLVELDIAS